MEEDESATAANSIVDEFQTYEDFLDSQITHLDTYYLEVLVTFSTYYVFLIPSHCPYTIETNSTIHMFFPTILLHEISRNIFSKCN